MIEGRVGGRAIVGLFPFEQVDDERGTAGGVTHERASNLVVVKADRLGDFPCVAGWNLEVDLEAEHFVERS